MYPVIRFAKEMAVHHFAEPLPMFAPHVSSHICWPWDVDPWMELNNGRTLTLYDLGRLPMMRRVGVIAAINKNGWGMAVAGASVRYRNRVRMFHKLTMRTAIAGWDERFLYVQQSLWHGEIATSSLLARLAVTRDTGIVPPAELAKALGISEVSPPLPKHAKSWIKTETILPWPPESPN